MEFENKITGIECPEKDVCFRKGTECPYEKYGCLRPLFKAKVVVHYPFYANTYLLPFFYSKVIDADRCENIKKEDLLQEAGWGKDIYKNIIENINDDTIHLFYASGDEKYVGELSAKLSERFVFKRIDFCKYYPRFVFVDFSTVAFLKLYGDKKISDYNSISNFLSEYFLNIIPSLLKKEGEKYKLNSDFLDLAEGKTINLFTDTIDQAMAFEMILLEADEGLQIEINPKNYQPDQFNYINIYLYSAPYNILFLKRKYQYLPLQLCDSDNIDDEYRFLFKDFDTKCYLIVSKTGANSAILDVLSKRLTVFFTYIFWKAKETPEHFYEAAKSFNYYAASRHPAIIFEDEYSFAKCLSLHVSPFDIKEFEQKRRSENRISKRLLFESLFGYSYNGKYNHDKEIWLMKNVKQIYSLITLNYLMNDVTGVSHSWEKFFSTTCEALQESTFNSDLYNNVFDDFIKIQVCRFVNEYETVDSNPIHECLIVWKIGKRKIIQRLVEETKNYFNRILIKDCNAEDVFSIDLDKKDFSIKLLLDDLLKTDGLGLDQKASLMHLESIFDRVLTISSISYDDIVSSNHLGLSSTFRNSDLKTLILSKTKMEQVVYTNIKM